MLRHRMADRRGIAPARAAAPFRALLLMLVAVACSPAASPSPSPAPVPTASPTPLATVLPTETAAPPTTLPTATETGSSGTAACTAADLKASHGIVEGAAGSRITSVVLVAAVACSIEAFPAFGVRDAHGAELIGSVAGGTGQIVLDPDKSYQTDVRFANWCAADPAFPLKLELRIGAETVQVTGSSFPEQGDMPPCNGTNGPELDSNGWEQAP